MAPKLSATRCPECSATLKVATDAAQLRCEYCGTTLSVEHKRAPRDPAQTRTHTVYVPPSVPVTARLMMFLGPLVPLVIVGNSFWPQLRALLPGLASQLPVECPLNGRVSLDGKTYSGEGTLIRAGANCEITIKNSTLEGDAIVDAGVNVKIRIEHSRLVAHKRAITTGANCQLSLRGKSEVHGTKMALDLGPNAELKLEDSKLSSEGVALHADANLSLEAEGGSIEGKTAIETNGWAARYELDGVKLVGAEKVKKRR